MSEALANELYQAADRLRRTGRGDIAAIVQRGADALMTRCGMTPQPARGVIAQALSEGMCRVCERVSLVNADRRCLDCYVSRPRPEPKAGDCYGTGCDEFPLTAAPAPAVRS